MMDGEPVQRLSAGYLTDSRTLNWPPGIFEGFTDGPGLPRTITGTNPAAGAEITEAVPTNARWRVKSILLIFETDGTVATRKVVLKFNDGVNDFVVLGPGGDQTQTASISGFRYEWIEGIGLEHAERTNVGSMMGLPPDLILFQGWSFLTDTINGVAGDDYAAPIFAVEEWIEE